MCETFDQECTVKSTLKSKVVLGAPQPSILHIERVPGDISVPYVIKMQITESKWPIVLLNSNKIYLSALSSCHMWPA